MTALPARVLLAGGYRNDVWKVRSANGYVIEKHYAEDPGSPNPMYPNLPDHEAHALAHLAGTGCAPELVSYRTAHDREGAQVVYRFVAGTRWRRGTADVARLLHVVHHLPAPRGMRRLHRSATEALAHADEVVADTSSAVARARMAAARPSGPAGRPVRRPSLVHTDCGPGNLVRSRDGLVLIDWQCPGVGDAVEDIACFLSPAMMILYSAAPHGATARSAFLEAYDDAGVVERYHRDGPAWHYRIASYCVWRAHSLAGRQPEIAARYNAALAAELAFLAAWPT